MWFKKKDVLRSEEMEICLKRINALSGEVELLKAKFEALNTNYNDLRGKFNRKLNIIKEQQEEDAGNETNLKAFTPFL